VRLGVFLVMGAATVATQMVFEAERCPVFEREGPMKRENLIFLLGDSIIDNGEYVRSGEPDVARQLEILLPHHTVVKRAVDGATSADVLASQITEVERAEHIILSAGGNDALEHIDLLDRAVSKRARDVLVRLWFIREGFRRSYAALLDRLAVTRRPVLVFTVYNPCFQGHGFDAAYQRAAESAVSIIDDVIQQDARRRSFEILELRTLLDDRADYANPIEPSAIGGAKLAMCLSDWVKSSATASAAPKAAQAKGTTAAE
jgi:lysophospholipase L1-like esterase